MQFCWTLRCALCTCRTVPCTISAFLEVCAAMARKRKRHRDTGYREQSILVRPPKASNAANVQQFRPKKRHLQQFVRAASGTGALITSSPDNPCFCVSNLLSLAYTTSLLVSETFSLVSTFNLEIQHFSCFLAFFRFGFSTLAPLWLYTQAPTPQLIWHHYGLCATGPQGYIAATCHPNATMASHSHPSRSAPPSCCIFCYILKSIQDALGSVSCLLRNVLQLSVHLCLASNCHARPSHILWLPSESLLGSWPIAERFRALPAAVKVFLNHVFHQRPNDDRNSNSSNGHDSNYGTHG